MTQGGSRLSKHTPSSYLSAESSGWEVLRAAPIPYTAEDKRPSCTAPVPKSGVDGRKRKESSACHACVYNVCVDHLSVFETTVLYVLRGKKESKQNIDARNNKQQNEFSLVT